MNDLVSRLLAAIEQVERDAPKIHRTDCLLVTDEWSLQYEPDACTCGEPAAVLRRCAADKALVLRCQEALQKDKERACGDEGDGMRSTLMAIFAQDVLDNRARAYGLSVEEETTQ